MATLVVGRFEGEWHQGARKDFDPRVPPEPVEQSGER